MKCVDLFICCSTYQLFNAITIVIQTKRKADILFTNPKVRDVIDFNALKTSDFFENIYEFYEIHKRVTDEIATTKFKYKISLIKKIIHYPFCNLYMHKLQNRDKEYEKIFLPYADIANDSICYWFKNKSGSLICLYEDGTFTYTFFKTEYKYLKKVGLKILFGSDIREEIQEIWVRNDKELQLGNYKNKIINIISHPNYLKEYSEIIFRIYRCEKADIYNLSKNFIFFDQNFSISEMREKQAEIAQQINSKVGKDNFIVKLHPFEAINDYDTNIDIFTKRIPFELLFMELDEYNSVLISTFSTACFTPKQVYDIEMPIILIYKLIELDNYSFFDSTYLELIEKIKASYATQQVYVPNSIEELMIIIEKYFNKDDIIPIINH